MWLTFQISSVFIFVFVQLLNINKKIVLLKNKMAGLSEFVVEKQS